MITFCSVEKIKEVLERKGYAFFTNGDYNLNIIGVRSNNLVANQFDDTLLLFYKIKNEWQIKSFAITTDAGTYWLKNPMDIRGTAILVPNQYRGVYAIRKHLNKYYALCQTNGNVQTYRDNDKDKILDMDAKTITTGMYGINIHRSNPKTFSTSVDKWSAGCQVFKSVDDFNRFMEICYKSRDLYGNKFTYTLITDNDLL
jgi:hypothetical protein